MQKANRRRTWILIGVVVFLGLAAVAERVRDRMVATTPLLRTATRAHLLQVECPDQPTRRFERVRGSWEMTSPWRVPADADAVAHLLALPQAPARFRYEPGRWSREALGLDKPVAVLTVDERRIALGGVDTMRRLRYVGLGETAAAIQDDVTPWLTAPPERFVDRHPLAGLYAVAGVRDGAGDWSAGDSDRLQRLVARAVKPQDGAPRGDPLEVLDGRGQPWRYVFDRETGVLARVSPPLLYELEPADAAHLREALRPPPPPAAS